MTLKFPDTFKPNPGETPAQYRGRVLSGKRTRTDTERLEWLLNKTIRVEHCGPDAEFTIQFRAIIPKERGSIRDLRDLVRHAVDNMMDLAEGRIPLDAAMNEESP